MTRTYARPNCLLVPCAAWDDVQSGKLSAEAFVRLVGGYNNCAQPRPTPTEEERWEALDGTQVDELREMLAEHFPHTRIDASALDRILREAQHNTELLGVVCEYASSFHANVATISSLGGFIINALRKYDIEMLRTMTERNYQEPNKDPIKRAIFDAEKRLRDEDA